MGKRIFLIVCLVTSMVSIACGLAPHQAKAFAGQDLHLQGGELISYQSSTSEYALVFDSGFSMSIGANQFSSDKAVVWVKSQIVEFRGVERVDYKARVYLEGNVGIEKGKATLAVDLNQLEAAGGGALVVRFDVSGEIFVTADKREMRDPQGMGL